MKARTSTRLRAHAPTLNRVNRMAASTPRASSPTPPIHAGRPGFMDWSYRKLQIVAQMQPTEYTQPKSSSNLTEYSPHRQDEDVYHPQADDDVHDPVCGEQGTECDSRQGDCPKRSGEHDEGLGDERGERSYAHRRVEVTYTFSNPISTHYYTHPLVRNALYTNPP